MRAPASTTLNAQLGWRANRWEIEVDVLNVLNRENYDIAYAYTSRVAGEPLPGVDDIHFHPAEPRTVRVTLTRRWCAGCGRGSSVPLATGAMDRSLQ